MDFLGIGPLELIIILVLGFLFFGPEKLPGMAAKAGKLYRNFRKATFDLSKSITDEVAADNKDLREGISSIGKAFTEDILDAKESKCTPVPLKIPESDRQWIDDSKAESAAEPPSSAKPVNKEAGAGGNGHKTTEPDADEYMI